MLACSFFCYQISLAIDTSIITLKKIFSTFFELLEQKSVKSNTIYYKRKKEKKDMEVLIIRNNKIVMIILKGDEANMRGLVIWIKSF